MDLKFPLTDTHNTSIIHIQGQLCCKTLIAILYCSKKPFMEAQEKARVHSLMKSPQLQSYLFTSSRKAQVINQQKFYFDPEILHK